MKGNNLLTFQTHLNKLMQNPEFANKFEEEKKRLGLAIKIAEFRNDKGLTQNELAKLSGITQQQLSKLENGENCNMITFLKVCKVLGIDINFKIQKTQISA